MRHMIHIVDVHRNPTDAQKRAGNYRMGHLRWNGLDITVENPKGSRRSGTDTTGKRWSVTMQHHYGYIKGTVGVDRDHVDCFLGPDLDSDKVWVVHQVDQGGSFDEHKVMLGFKTEEAAEAGYLANYSKGWKLGPVEEMDVQQFKAWLRSSGMRKAIDGTHLDIQMTPHPSIPDTHVISATIGGVGVGELHIGPNRNDPEKYSASHLWVQPEFRRQGIATALYDHAYQQGLRPIIPDHTKLSADGQAFWNARRVVMLGQKPTELQWKPARKGVLVITRKSLEPESIRPITGLYSNVEKLVQSKFPQRFSGQQLQGGLSGTSPEEQQYSGVRQFFGTKKLDRDTVLQPIHRNASAVMDDPYIGNDTRYRQWSTPGLKGYTEHLLRLDGRDYAARYESDHWRGHLNVLAHIRYGVARDLQGNPVTHVDEIQSDWHQDGRKHGYKDPEYYDRLTAARQHLDQTAHQMGVARYGNGNPSFEPHHSTKVNAHRDLSDYFNMESVARQSPDRFSGADAPYLKKLQTEYSMTPDQIEQAKHSWQTIADDHHYRGNAVPDAPFKKTWHELAFKRALVQAVDNGSKRMTWTTGDTQNDRYPGGVTRQHGMEGFYDEILPQYAAKLGKRFGAQVGQTELITKGKASDQKVFDRQVRLARQRFEEGAWTHTPEDQRDYQYAVESNDPVRIANELRRHHYLDAETPDGLIGEHRQKVHYIDITPAMREEVKQNGLPLWGESNASIRKGLVRITQKATVYPNVPGQQRIDFEDHPAYSTTEQHLRPYRDYFEDEDWNRLKNQPAMYHVTTNKTAVLRDGLRARTELGGSEGLGGGTGDPDADKISVTYSPDHARMIEGTLKLAGHAVRGSISALSLMDQYHRLHDDSQTPYDEDALSKHLGECAGIDVDRLDDPAQQAKLEQLHATPQAKYRLLRNLEMAYHDSQFSGGERHEGYVAPAFMTAPFAKVSHINPDEVATMKVLPHAGPLARPNFVPQEHEFRFRPEHLDVDASDFARKALVVIYKAAGPQSLLIHPHCRCVIVTNPDGTKEWQTRGDTCRDCLAKAERFNAQQDRVRLMMSRAGKQDPSGQQGSPDFATQGMMQDEAEFDEEPVERYRNPTRNQRSVENAMIAVTQPRDAYATARRTGQQLRKQRQQAQRFDASDQDVSAIEPTDLRRQQAQTMRPNQAQVMARFIGKAIRVVVHRWTCTTDLRAIRPVMSAPQGA